MSENKDLNFDKKLSHIGSRSLLSGYQLRKQLMSQNETWDLVLLYLCNRKRNTEFSNLSSIRTTILKQNPNLKKTMDQILRFFKKLQSFGFGVLLPKNRFAWHCNLVEFRDAINNDSKVIYSNKIDYDPVVSEIRNITEETHRRNPAIYGGKDVYRVSISLQPNFVCQLFLPHDFSKKDAEKIASKFDDIIGLLEEANVMLPTPKKTGT